MLLITFCNQGGARRPFGMAAVEPDNGRFHWIGLGAGRKDTGATGFAFRDGLLFVAVQSAQPRLAAFDPATWRQVAARPFVSLRDPHSLAAGSGGLYAASTGDNAVYRLAVRDGALVGEELVWRHPGTSPARDDVHVNSLTFADGKLLVSGFGPRDPAGGWDVEDGFVFDVAAGAPVARGLHHPHSLACDGGRIAVAESYAGRVRIGGWDGNRIVFTDTVEVPGYPRGLCWQAGSLLIGSSMLRRVSRSSQKTLEHTDPGDGRSRVYRFDLAARTLTPLLDCTDRGSEIYAIGRFDGEAPSLAAAPPAWKTLPRGLRA